MDFQTGVFLVVCLASILSTASADFQAHSDEAGVHCGNITLLAQHQQEQLQKYHDHYHCIHCLFPQNCEKNNTCRLGTSGSTCEQCQQHEEIEHRYHRVGSMCTLCPDVPWAAVGFGIYFLLVLCISFFMGFSETVCTKMKLLCHFLQYLLLTMHIKVAWPDNVVQFVSNAAFASFNTNILNPECLFPTWSVMSDHYFEWLSSLGIPVVVIVLGYFLDKSMKKLGKGQNSDTSVSRKVLRRTTVRRLVFFVAVVMYMPAAVSCVRTYLCSNTVPTELVLDHSENVFLLNNNVRCETFTFQTIHFVATLYMVIMIILCPLLIVFFTLRQKKWDLLYTEWTRYSPVYEAYKDRFCFWESIPMVRTFVAIIITESFPFSPRLQVLVQLGMTAVYMVLVVILRPYRPSYWGHPLLNVHTIFEVISNLVICVVLGVGASILFDQYESLYGLAVIALVSTVLVIWLAMVLSMSCETRQAVNLNQVVSFVEDGESNDKQKTSKKKFGSRKSRRVEQDSKFEKHVKENKQKIDF